jgi:hypothetical protein
MVDGLIEASRHDLVARDEDGTHRNFSQMERVARLLESQPHEGLVEGLCLALALSRAVDGPRHACLEPAAPSAGTQSIAKAFGTRNGRGGPERGWQGRMRESQSMEPSPVIAKLVSGGQTGVDRAALDAALDLGIACGGWCPRGRRAEDGRIPDRYPLAETPTGRYPQRTEWNVREADGTLVLTRGAPRGGTALTIALARRIGRPCLVLDLGDRAEARTIREWIAAAGIRVLNVAGPRESEAPGIHGDAHRLLLAALSLCPGGVHPT